jgi:hypothetical protein
MSVLSSDVGKVDQLVMSFLKLFSEKVGTVKGMVCDIDLTDEVPVRSHPYQCAPPKLQILREVVQDLLDKGVVRKNHSQYASPAFLVPKPNGLMDLIRWLSTIIC